MNINEIMAIVCAVIFFIIGTYFNYKFTHLEEK